MRKVFAATIAFLPFFGLSAAHAKPAPIPLSQLAAGACVAMAPQGWGISVVDQQSSSITVMSPGGNLRAAYGIIGVNAAQAAGYYGGQYRSPQIFALFMTQTMFGSEPITRPTQSLPHGFQMISWDSANGYSGYTVFRRYTLPSDPGGYVVSVYIGGAPTSEAKRLVPLTMGVATSIRCRAQVQPPPASDFHPVQGAKCFGGECSERDAVSSDTNAILGTRYMHDPKTGQGYYVGNDDWQTNGPQGPGVYKQNGNNVTKLAPGLQ